MAERPIDKPHDLSVVDIQRLHPNYWVGIQATKFDDDGKPTHGLIITVGKKEDVVKAYGKIDSSLLPYFITEGGSTFSHTTGSTTRVLGGRRDKMHRVDLLSG